MAESANPIPGQTLEAIARSFFKETVNYGFRQVDYLRFVNLILDMSMKVGPSAAEAERDPAANDPAGTRSMPLHGEGIQIREFNTAIDRSLLEKWMKDRNGRYFLLSRTTAKPLDFDKLLTRDRNILGVIALSDGTPIGLMAFLDCDQAQHKAELRKLVGEPQQRGKGFGKKATELWIRYGVSGLGLKKIYLSTLETDVKNIRLNEELGFQVEGILRNECFFDGEYHDILRMALLAG